jgi:MoaA/NifB/PqqE/SkfB family radical SAM enzyme
MGAIAIAAKRAGIDVAFTTNAVNLREDAASAVLPVTSWIKVSFNAGTPKTYARIHGTQEKDYAAVLSNMERAVRLRAELGSSCTLGFQMVLLPENWDEAAQLAKTVRDIGADYLVIKPYSQNPQSHTQKYAGVSYEKAHELAGELEVLNNTCFSVIFRYNTMERSGESHKPYNRCLALPFWAYMDAGGCIWGCIWGCSSFLVEAGFNYGNILEQSFADIWHGEQRRKNLAWVADHLDASTCRINCRMDTINAYLWELKHPGGHVNFI